MNIENRIYPFIKVNLSVIVHSCNSKKQRLILAEFYANSAPFIANKIAKFQINLPKKAIVTTAFVRSFQNTSVSVCLTLFTKT